MTASCRIFSSASAHKIQIFNQVKGGRTLEASALYVFCNSDTVVEFILIAVVRPSCLL